MANEKDIIKALQSVAHPESGKDIISAGILQEVSVASGRVGVSLAFLRARDPFEQSVKKQARAAIEEAFPQFKDKVDIMVKPMGQPAKPKEEPLSNNIAHIIAVASGKGGVGKSTVACNLAIALAQSGYKVGLLDADIYGPSQPKMFGLEDYKPLGEKVDGKDMIIPAEKYGVRLMSIGFFISPQDALIWRGAMATNALKQMINQTMWGELDFLLIDLPPGTGDVHLTIVQEMKVGGAVIVSTPQDIALADVVRGIAMFRAEGIGIPVLGIIENMAWFTPEELPENRYYIFGRGGAEALAKKEGIDLLAQIPIVMGVTESGDKGEPVATTSGIADSYFRSAAQKIVDKA